MSTNNLLQSTGSEIDSAVCSIIVGVMSVVATYVSTLIVDRLGRKILLLSSIIVMGLCTFLIGLYFYLHEIRVDVSSIGFIPLVSLCVFIILFSVGFGPIPWMLIGEILPAQIKGKFYFTDSITRQSYLIKCFNFKSQAPLARSLVWPTGFSHSQSRSSSRYWSSVLATVKRFGYSRCSVCWVRSS